MPHPPKHVLRSQVETMEDQWRQSVLTGDVTLMDKLLSDDFLGITANGQVNTKAQYLDRLRSRNLVIKSIEMSDEKVKLNGGTAVVTSLAQIDGSSEGVSLEGSYRYTRVYQREPNGTWKITNFEATRIPPPLAARRTEPLTAPPLPPQ